MTGHTAEHLSEMGNVDAIQGTCIVFATAGTCFFFVLNTKELPRKYGLWFTHNSWDLRYGIRVFLLLVCLEFVGFYLTAGIIFSYSYYVSTEPLSVYTNQSELISISLSCGLIFVALALFSKRTVWTAVVSGVIFMIIMHVLFTCSGGEKYCFYLKVLITVVICGFLALIFNGIATLFAGWMAPLAVHVVACYTPIQSYAIIIKGFEYWQLEDNYWWIPIVLSFGVGLMRWFAEWCVMNTTCCGMDGVSRTLKTLAGDIDGEKLDEDTDKLRLARHRQEEELKASKIRLEVLKLRQRRRDDSAEVGLTDMQLGLSENPPEDDENDLYPID